MSEHHHEHDHGEHGGETLDTTGGHGMLVFGDDPVYLGHLPMFMHPHNYQAVLEVQLGPAAAQALADDRAAGPADLYTWNPTPFRITDVAPSDGSDALTEVEGQLFSGHFERGGRPIADAEAVEIVTVTHFAELDVDAEATADDELGYLCFGRPGALFLAHHVKARPSFDQVLAVHFVEGTVTNQAGRPLDEDVSEIGYSVAQPVGVSRADAPEHRLAVGDVETVELLHTASITGAHGFRVDLQVDAELYLEIKELQ